MSRQKDRGPSAFDTVAKLLSIRRRAIKQMTTEEVARTLLSCGRNEAPGTLFDLYFTARVPEAVLRDVLIGVWTMAEFPARYVSRAVWLHWFDVANRVARYPVPAAPIQIFRGATPKFRRGMSWTTDRDRALWFANRYSDRPGHRAGKLYQVTVPSEVVLADVDAVAGEGGRGEGEIIADPRRLPPVRLVRR